MHGAKLIVDNVFATALYQHPLQLGQRVVAGRWDGCQVKANGTWAPAPGKDPRKSLKKGHLHFSVDGERMKGEWILIRTSTGGRRGKEQWILRKIDDGHVGNPTGLTDRHLTSIKTGRTMQEIAAGKKAKELAEWKDPPRHGEGDRDAKRRGGGADPKPSTPPPCFAWSPSPFRGGLGKRDATGPGFQGHLHPFARPRPRPRP